MLGGAPFKRDGQEAKLAAPTKDKPERERGVREEPSAAAAEPAPKPSLLSSFSSMLGGADFKRSGQEAKLAVPTKDKPERERGIREEASRRAAAPAPAPKPSLLSSFSSMLAGPAFKRDGQEAKLAAPTKDKPERERGVREDTSAAVAEPGPKPSLLSSFSSMLGGAAFKRSGQEARLSAPSKDAPPKPGKA